ncbi:GNAT family N-acetyltransferase [Aliagarivorans taiwanensis]|uniref:GNAT family N-acetyltransferase n=1 Tax=Aliagarivorans taiwanensis TaxID=561966 RepID=UPI00040498C8|nr:GNAT family N-acetyltransferase [Aliagarivorans taiwanensis]
MALQFKRYSSIEHKAVLDLAVAPQQQKFVGVIKDILTLASDTVQPWVIEQVTKRGNGQDTSAVGFFLIDTTYSENYEFARKGGLGLRALFIDQRYQGQGLASLTLTQLSEWVFHEYPQHPSLYLTVNCKNPAAYHCYKKVGFVDTEQLYHGGQFGPQHIMVLNAGAKRSVLGRWSSD